MRHFTLTTLVVFAAVAFALYVLQRGEETFFAQVQREQRDIFAHAQAELARQHEVAARDSLLVVHEAGHVNLARLMANTLWETYFAPFIGEAQRHSTDHCLDIGASSDAGVTSASAAKDSRLRLSYRQRILEQDVDGARSLWDAPGRPRVADVGRFGQRHLQHRYQCPRRERRSAMQGAHHRRGYEA